MRIGVHFDARYACNSSHAGGKNSAGKRAPQDRITTWSAVLRVPLNGTIGMDISAVHFHARSDSQILLRWILSLPRVPILAIHFGATVTKNTSLAQ